MVQIFELLFPIGLLARIGHCPPRSQTGKPSAWCIRSAKDHWLWPCNGFSSEWQREAIGQEMRHSSLRCTRSFIETIFRSACWHLVVWNYPYSHAGWRYEAAIILLLVLYFHGFSIQNCLGTFRLQIVQSTLPGRTTETPRALGVKLTTWA